MFCAIFNSVGKIRKGQKRRGQKKRLFCPENGNMKHKKQTIFPDSLLA